MSICDSLSTLLKSRALYISEFDGYLRYPIWDKVMQNQIKISKSWEPDETQFVANSLNLPGSVINIGAHVGYWVIFCGLNSKEKIYAFEPFELNYKLLNYNIKKYGLLNRVETAQLAISDTEGFSEFMVNPINSGNIKIVDTKKSTDNVNTVTLDGYFNNLNKLRSLNLIIIDVEGYEFEVIKGAINLISKFKPNLLLEFNPNFIEKRNQNPQDFLNYLHDIGYYIGSTNLGIYPRVDSKDCIISEIVNRQYEFCNLSLVHKDRYIIN